VKENPNILQTELAERFRKVLTKLLDKTPKSHIFYEIWDFIGLFWSFSIKKSEKKTSSTGGDFFFCR
jgi:hypothetical protein